MTVLLSVLLFLSFLQGALLPFDLVLIFLVVRSFISSGKENLWLAFGFGLLVSVLQSSPLGFLSLVYLAAVVTSHLVRKTHFASHWIAILPLSIIFLLAKQFLLNIFLGSSLNYGFLLVETALVLPFYFTLRLWEERFVVKKEIRLKIGK